MFHLPMFTTKNIADAYDQIGLNFSSTRRKLTPEVVNLIPKLEKNAKVLDLGCGNGVLLTALPDDVIYTGIDISQTLIDIAKNTHPNSNFIKADLLDANTWKDLGKFDLIVALAVFHHLPNPDDHDFLLKQMKKHLNPNGAILISNWRLLQPKFDEFRTDEKHLTIPFHQGTTRDFYAFTDSEIQNRVRELGFNQTKSFISKDNLYITAKIS